MSKEAEEYLKENFKKYIPSEHTDISASIDEVSGFMESYHQHRLDNDIPSDEEIYQMFPMVSACSSDISEAAKIRRDAVKWFVKQHLLKTKQ